MVFTKLVSYLLLCSLFTCSIIFAKNKTSNYRHHAHQIRKEFIKEMEKAYGWTCIGTGASMPSLINDIHVEFALPRRATLEEARALEVMAIEKFSEMMNADEKIRPFLCEYPFPPHRTEVALSFYTSLGTQPTDGSVAYLFNAKNKLFYYSYDPLAERTLVRFFEEPYPEAKKIVESSPKLNPFVHQEKPYESPIDATFDSYLTEMFKKHELERDRIGEKVADGIIEEVVARLIYFHPTKIEKARELQVVATEKLLEAINSNEKLRPYLKNYPFSLHQLKVSVLFRKPNYFPYFNGTLERVSNQGDELIYFSEREEPGKLSEPVVIAKESYREAVEKVRNSPRSKNLNVKWQSL